MWKAGQSGDTKTITSHGGCFYEYTPTIKHRQCQKWEGKGADRSRKAQRKSSMDDISQAKRRTLIGTGRNNENYPQIHLPVGPTILHGSKFSPPMQTNQHLHHQDTRKWDDHESVKQCTRNNWHRQHKQRGARIKQSNALTAKPKEAC